MKKLLLIITVLLFSVISIGVAGCSVKAVIPEPSTPSSNSPTVNPYYIRFSLKGIDMLVGETKSLSGFVETNIPSDVNLLFSLDGSGVGTVSVNQNGDVTGLKKGTAKVKVLGRYNLNEYSASVIVNVTGDYLELHDLNGNKVEQLTLYVGDSLDLTNDYIYTTIPLESVNVVLEHGADNYVSLSSGKTITATNASGNDYATVKLDAPDYDKQYSFRIFVKDLPSLTFSTENISVYVGDTLNLNEYVSITQPSISYAITSGQSYASVNKTTLKGVAVGNATVTASLVLTESFVAHETITATATVNVTERPQLSLPDYITIIVGEVVDLNDYITTNIDSPTITWTQTDGASYASFATNGQITGVAAGQSHITATVTVGSTTLSASVTVNVETQVDYDPDLVVVYRTNIYAAHVTFTSLGDFIASAQQAESTQAHGDVPAKELTEGVDYTYHKSGGTCSLILKRSYLSQLAQKTGQYKLTFTDTASKEQIVNVLVVDDAITTLEQLQAIGNDEESLKKSYVLGADIDCQGSSGYNFEPIGEYYNDNYWNSGSAYKNKPFYGTLNGAGHKIYNLVIDSDKCSKEIHKNVSKGGWQGGKNIAFISYLGNTGVICNITFENVCIKSSRQCAGVVAGTVAGTIENVKVDSLKVFTTDNTWADATLGGNYSYTTQFCSVNTGAWDGGGEYGLDCFSGAFAGIVSDGGRIINCISMTTIKSTEPKAIRGFVGKSYGVISGCYSYAISPFSMSTMRNFSSRHVDFNPLSTADPNYDLITIMSCYNSDDPSETPRPSDILIDLNHISDSDTAGKGFTYPAFKGYWNNSTQQLIGAEFKNGTWESYNNTYYTLITNSKMIENLSDLNSASLYGSYDKTIWNINDGSVPTLKTTYTSNNE